MRILHVNDEAGVACILAKYQQKIYGHDSRVIKLSRVDKYGIYEYYKEYITQVKTEEQFLNYVFKEAETMDIIHVHGRSDIIIKLRKKFSNSKKIIIHYHGTDIRGIKNQKLPHRSRLSDTIIRLILTYRKGRDTILLKKRIKLKAQIVADAVLVSTIDLLNYTASKNNVKAIYLPNPIDIEHFRPDIKGFRKDFKSRALTIDNEATDTKMALKYLKENNFDSEIKIHDRMKQTINYQEMPEFLKQFDTYVDIRYINNKLIPALSKTALEALSCGLNVIDHRLNNLRGLPPQHCPSNVTNSLSNIYKNIMD
ncbi:glycosyltransferase family protein [Candidatus Nitrosocosmicus sp. R]